jgi:hypothetical protein
LLTWRRSASDYDTAGLEPIIPRKRDLEQKRAIFNWSSPAKDGFPPHLEITAANNLEPITELFDSQQLQRVSAVAQVVSFIIPDEISHQGTPYAGPTLADCEKYNRDHKSQDSDIMHGENVGCNEDWYSDARFAQQHLSGVNPTTIKMAPPKKVDGFIEEAGKQGLERMKAILSNGESLLIQDYSDFREATGMSDDDMFQSLVPELDSHRNPTGKSTIRYGCASVIIFQLHEDGRLHPLAITLDYRGSFDKSITIFNDRLTPDDEGTRHEKDDWPWRYAKTCAQISDWARHEIAVHLVETHMVEEAIIVATHRTIPEEHLIYEILSPHWFRTLAINAAARAVLIPQVIARVSGFGPDTNPATSRAVKMMNWCYTTYNFQAKYIPNDLKTRGFDMEAQMGDKYRNYPYASDMHLLWGVIRDFVASVLATKFKFDKDVADDVFIASWCEEIQTKGQIPTFPTITTVDQLVDAVTMCIHIASAQHTAVNYLQDYYYSFVPAKPPALCTPLPKDLATLQSYTEKDLTAALPIGTDGAKWKDWLLAAQVPELLSFRVDGRYNLLSYAKSLYNVNKDRTVAEDQKYNCKEIKDSAALLYSRLIDCGAAFQFVSANQTEGSVPYLVLQPEVTAVSISI